MPRFSLRGDEPGHYQGKHFTEYVNEVKRLRRAGKEGDAEQLLLKLLEATERESNKMSTGVAPWYYEQLAIIYRARKDTNAEIAVLERFARQRHALGAKVPVLLQRLEKLRAGAGKAG